MKKMWYYTLMLFALCFTACEDTDKLEADINSLNDRVEALENKVEMLNGNIKALNILCQDGMIISKVEHDAENGVYTLSLSDGTTLKLAERVDGFASVPLVTINENGNWAVSYDDGASFVEIKKGDAPVYAIGKDGITPEFRVGTEDFWEISLDGGNNYVRVLDENGNPVKAVYDPATNPNQQFTGVVQKTDCLEITLSSGNTVKVPIVPDFFCYFDRAITGEQNINPGGTKTFNVHINGAESTVITAPMGWKATLAEADAITHVAVLTVIAPKGKPATRAIADNTRDISILAMKGGLATLTKIQVNPIEVETGGGDEPTPPETITNLNIPLTVGTILETKGKYSSSNQLAGENDYWFTRYDVGTFPTTQYVVEDIQGVNAIKAYTDANVNTKGWNNNSFGFHCAKKFAAKKYNLSFDVNTGAGDTSGGILIRTAQDDRAFILIGEQDKLSTVFTFTQKQGSRTIQATFDLSRKSMVNPSSNPVTPENIVNVEPADIEMINIYFYNNTQGSTLYVSNVKIEQVVE